MPWTPVLAGLLIAAIAALFAELPWRVLRPRDVRQMTACWMVGILTRLAVALAGLAICVGLFHLAAPPLVSATAVGYAVALAVETRVTLRRIRRAGTTETKATSPTTTTSTPSAS